jgi:recombination protein RecA
MALKFYSSVRIDIRRIQQLKYREEIVGSRTRIKVVKNKVAPPFRRAEFDIMYGVGISKASELLELGAKYDILSKSGTWILYNDEKIGQGRESAKAYLEEHKDFAKKLEKEILKQAVATSSKNVGK